MKVLVWKAWGDCKVYQVGSDNFETIKSLVSDCTEYYDHGDRTKLSNCSTIEQLIAWVADNTDDDDCFEYFNVTETIECK